MPEIQMPKLSDTMTKGTLVSWKKFWGAHAPRVLVSATRRDELFLLAVTFS